LKEADAGRPVNEIWRQDGISSATSYKWKAKDGGLEASDVKRLKELEQENSRLKRMYAELSFENAALKDVITKKLYGPLSDGRSSSIVWRTMIFLFSGLVGP
jgi:putative transposase